MIGLVSCSHNPIVCLIGLYSCFPRFLTDCLSAKITACFKPYIPLFCCYIHISLLLHYTFKVVPSDNIKKEVFDMDSHVLCKLH